MINLINYVITVCPTDVQGVVTVDADTQYNVSVCFNNNIINKSFQAVTRIKQIFLDSTEVVKIVNTTFIDFQYTSESFLFASISILQLNNVTMILTHDNSAMTFGLVSNSASTDVSTSNINITVKQGVSMVIFGTTKYLQVADSRIIAQLLVSTAQYSNMALSSSYIQLSNVEINYKLKASGQILQIAAATQISASNLLIKQFSGVTIGNQAALCASFDNCFVVYNLTQADTFAVEYYNKTHKIPTKKEFESQSSSFLYSYTSTTDNQYFVSTANFAQKQQDETNTAVYLGYCANISTCWCDTTATSPFCTCDSVNQRLFENKCLVQTNDLDGSIYVSLTPNTKKYFKCPTTTSLPVYVLNENIHACFTQCDSSCSNTINSTSTANCDCKCSLPVIIDVKAGKCTQTCANDSFIYFNNQCFEKCSNCLNGDAYLDGKSTVYYNCTTNYILQNGQCVKTTKSTNQFIIGISVGSGCLAVVATVLVSVKGCLQMKKNRAQRV
ncbi:Hypothetical_protein [Hexamita inflata]|uniref:Hypothetical_protein n=1 Tax=Hexamita inflata TaxID=28002 RepID=A0AA86QS72_9EUKA|nr:Hypothetical protein HINF_LOCUS48221 [Hexamita inflata]